jgi:Fe-coproporphyrin III synthase
MPDLRIAQNLFSDRIAALPLAIVYITDRCNSKCITCDYWRYGQTNMAQPVAERLAAELRALGTHMVLVSGGEPLLHPHWHDLVSIFRAYGQEIVMLTSGILLPKNLERVAALSAHTIVSLDAATAETYQKIRGIDGLALVERGVRGLVERKASVSLRCTVQRSNYAELPAIIRAAREWGVERVSFLAVDVSTHQAFARQGEFEHQMALSPDDLVRFDAVLDGMEDEFASEFKSGFIAESPARLRRLRQYFGALIGQSAFPTVRCNAPRFSAVIETDGSLKPCFFLPSWGKLDGRGLRQLLNDPAAQQLRRAQRMGQREECGRCVCSAFRSARELIGADLLR